MSIRKALGRALVETAALLAGLLTADLARAQTGDASTAQALYEQAKPLFDAKDFVHTCPLIAESYRIDPATGALLALATCHEKQGKLASAWAEFTDVQSRSKREGRADRDAFAKERRDALTGRLSKLTINVDDKLANAPGFELRRDGVVLGKVMIGVTVPVDGGEHTVEAVATGRKQWKTTVSVADERDAKTVTVPPLEDGTGAGGSQAAADATQPRQGLQPLRVGGIVVAGVGVVGLAVGSIFGLSAISKNNDASQGCSSDRCTDLASYNARTDARKAANISTVAFVAGGVLAAAGVTMFVLGGAKGKETAGLDVRAAVGATGAELVLRGVFQ